MIKDISKLIIRLLLIITLIIPMFNPVVVEGNTDITIQDLREGLEELELEKIRIENSKQLTQSEINSTNQKIYNTRLEQDEIEADIVAAEEKIKESEATIAQLTTETEALLRYYQLTKGNDVFNNYISDADSLQELIRRLEAVDQITSYAQETMETLEAIIIENEETKEELAVKTAELEIKIDEMVVLLSSLNGELSSISEINADIDDQIENQKKQIEYYSQICSSETIAISSCTSIGNAYGWLKPLVKGVVTSDWGYRTNPITGERYSYHNAVDIGGNPEGTKIYAAAPGRISNVTFSSCGGNIVYMYVIVNNQKYTLEYAHLLSVNVKEGQNVTTDTVIGTVGGWSTAVKNGGYDSCTTGAHLHFGVSKGHYGVDYSSWNSFLANGLRPPGYPSSGVYWSTR